MTPAEALRAAAASGDEAAVRGILAGLTEADRAELAPVAREIVAAVAKKGIDAVGSLGTALLLAYGTLPVSEIRKLGWRTNHTPRHLEDVLRRRSPDRLGPIVEHLLDDVGARAWQAVRTLVREGTIPRPDRPSYTIAMLAGTRYGAADLVTDDPGLLEDEVWRLFEVEGGGEDSLAAHEKYTGDAWGDLFRDLATGDPAMRQRLLDCSLEALARDFGSFRAGWFSRFHESLAPTDDERADRAGLYLKLLRSRVGPTVSFAVAALTRIASAGRLPPDLLVDRIGPMLGESAAGTAKAGLVLVGRAAAGSPDLAHRAAIVATDALAHSSADVQRAAIALIDSLVGDEGDAALAGAVRDRLPGIAASQRQAAVALVARLGSDASGVVSAAAADPTAHPVAARGQQNTSPIDPAREVPALTSIEALVDVAVSVLETGEPADDVERVLDAVGRLAGDRSDPVARLTAPIARRARTILARRDSSPFTGFDPRADVAAVLLAWATGELVAPGAVHGSVDPGAGVFLSARAHEVATGAASGSPFVGVAAPTHRGGWIDPAVLVRRLASRPPGSTLDLVAALLRLAPDGRDAALGSATGLAGEVGAVLRYALGGEEPIGATAAWWVAAARVRAPGEDDAAVEERHPHLGPDAGRAARIQLRSEAPSGRPEVMPTDLRLGIDAMPDRPSVDLPTVLMLRDPSTFAWSGTSDPAILRWIATIQPGYREAWAAVGSLLIGRNVDWWSAEWGNRAFLEPFLDPVTRIGPNARTLIAIALGAKEAGERGLASDVAGIALADGRLASGDLAAGLAAAAAVACDRPNRWAHSLAEVAAVSSEHALAVAEAAGRVLPALSERPPARLVPLLRLLDELLAETSAAPQTGARPALARLAASGGQAGRLARSILSRA